MPIKSENTRVDRVCQIIIDQKLGEISDLPEALTKFIYRTYREFITSYLNVLRQKEGKAPDWFPESLSIYPELVDDMRHFFSDHQHVTRAFLTLNKQMAALREINKEKQPKLYAHTIASILPHPHP